MTKRVGPKERVEDVADFALRNDISTEKAQELIDRRGNDREKLEQAALLVEDEDEAEK